LPDNTVAIASLHLHSRNTGSPYESICKDWVNYAKKHWLEPESGLLCSTITAENGKPIEEPRGSMLGWSIFFMYRFDPEFAAAQYNAYKEQFSTNLWAFRLFKERGSARNTDLGDIDSGPVVLGYSIPANAFAFAGAVAMQDNQTAKQMHRLVGLGAKRQVIADEFRYKPRISGLSVSPLAEALGLYFETMKDW
jgi:hypothetical protein